MKAALLAYEEQIRAVNIPGLLTEFTIFTDEDPKICSEMLVFRSREPKWYWQIHRSKVYATAN